MAYAAVITVMHSIKRLSFPHIRISVYEELELLRDVLKKLDVNSHKSIDRSVINALDAEIRKVVCKLEDVVESYALYHYSLPPSQGLDVNKKGVDFTQKKKLKGVEKEIDSFLKTVKKLRNEYNEELQNTLPGEEDDGTVSPIDDDFGGNKSTMVGLSDQSEKIRNELLEWQSELKTVSVVGMAGIGKTLLATDIYHHPLIVQHFDLRVWVSVGPIHQINNIFVDILAQIERMPRNLYIDKDMFQIIALLEESLHGRRYLIVLDDVWSTTVCNTLKCCLESCLLPNSGNGRRILLTTRREDVAEYPNTTIHHMPFLNNEDSWDLLRQNVFADKSFSPQLEKAGRKIAENCEGLPLLILAVANILCGLDTTEVYWEKVANKKTATFTDAYDEISKVLYSSYEYLPQHLKPCFLYMGVFPQSYVIPLPKIINLWSVEDFLEPGRLRTLENFAMKCMEELVSNSLAIVCKHSSNFRIKSSKLHSAYWHLCVKEARNNKFFQVLKILTDCSKDYMESQRRLSVQNNILLGIKGVHESMSATLTARSLVCTGEDHQYPVPICLNLMLLKVLDALAIRFYEFPTEVLKLVQLRYLALTHNGELPSSVSKLQQLQCLIARQHHNIKFVRDSSRPEKWHMRLSNTIGSNLPDPSDSAKLPKEIWDLQELRHLRINGSNLPDPSDGAKLPKLLTLYLNAHSCTEGVFRSIPHLKKLGIRIELQPNAAETLSCFKHIGRLNELESLKCVVVNPRLRSQVVAPPDHLSNFPGSTLKKLSLNGLGYSWKYMSAIGSLVSLQVLKLRCSAFQGPHWETEAGQFKNLEFLLLEDIDLLHWKTDDGDCFPRLRRLIIQHCYKLKMIPPRIGAIPTLESMEVDDCSPSVVASAKQIQEKSKYSLQVVINSSWNHR